MLTDEKKEKLVERAKESLKDQQLGKNAFWLKLTEWGHNIVVAAFVGLSLFNTAALLALKQFHPQDYTPSLVAFVLSSELSVSDMAIGLVFMARQRLDQFLEVAEKMIDARHHL